MKIDQITSSPITGDTLKTLSNSSVARLNFSVYAEVSQIVSLISAVDMCCFSENWHFSPKPWLINGISFISTITIDDFSVAVHQFLPKTFATPIPYCRLQTRHRKSTDIALEFACYGNGTSTQWIIRTGHLTD